MTKNVNDMITTVDVSEIDAENEGDGECADGDVNASVIPLRCDTEEGIRSYLADGLEGLHDLIRDRALAYRNGGEKTNLRRFIILGRYATDGCGNFGPCSFEMKPDMEESGDVDAVLRNVLPPVMSDADFSDCFAGVWYRASYGGAPFLPPHDAVCDECQEGWTLDNCQDATLEVDRFYHRRCYLLRQERQDMTYYAELLKGMGMDKAVVEPVANGYNNGPLARPWCKAKTTAGDITFGLRKRVYEICWDDIAERRDEKLKKLPREERERAKMNLTADFIFPGEDVTKDRFMIHAWSEKKLIEYLTKIAISAGLPLFSVKV